MYYANTFLKTLKPLFTVSNKDSIRKKTLSQKEVQKLRNQIKESESGTKLGVQYWITLFNLSVKHGLRPGEAVSIKKHHIDFEQNDLIIEDAKGGKNRSVAIPDNFLQDLEEIGRGKEAGEYLFQSPRTKRHITVRTYEKRMRKWAVNAGIYRDHQGEITVKNVTEKIPEKKRVTPHTLRHTFATEHLRSGTPIEKVSDMLGHEDVKTTYSEYSHLTTEDHRDYQNQVDL